MFLITAAWLQSTGLPNSSSSRHRNRFRDPGAAADIDGVAIGVIEEGAPAKLIGKLHVVVRGNAVKVGRMQRLGGAADDLNAAAREKIANEWFISSVHLFTTAIVRDAEI